MSARSPARRGRPGGGHEIRLSLLRSRHGQVYAVFDPEHHLPGNRFNDGKPIAGPLWAGTWMTRRGCRAVASIASAPISPASVRSTASSVSNALCWSPTTHPLLADSCKHHDLGVGFEPDAGEINNRRVIRGGPYSEGDPDRRERSTPRAACGGALGGLARHSLRSKGRVDRVVKLPVEKPTSPMFGGPRTRYRFYVTSASIQLSSDEISGKPQAGGVFAFEPGVKGCRRRTIQEHFLGFFPLPNRRTVWRRGNKYHVVGVVRAAISVVLQGFVGIRIGVFHRDGVQRKHHPGPAQETQIIDSAWRFSSISFYTYPNEDE